LPYVHGKTVLDLGCIGNSNPNNRSAWLHDTICREARRVVGVDLREDDIRSLNEEGYNIVACDVESMELNETFEVVVAADVIEHLSNCGNFLDRVFLHLLADGVFLVSTPNPANILNFFQLIGLGEITDNPWHTCYFTPHVLRVLAARHGFELIEVAFVHDTEENRRSRVWYQMPFFWMSRGICFLMPQFSWTYCYALKKKGNPG
jgi:2-polyprenyl-3-methyl-5-hydroxy-6-metoxy-1,4-benzoquinol methylase